MDRGQRERESENKTEIALRETKRRSMRCKVSRVSHKKQLFVYEFGRVFPGASEIS